MTRLPMCAGQHGSFCLTQSEAVNRGNECVHLWQQHGADGCFYHQTVSRIVDVFGRAGEMNPFANRLQRWALAETFLHNIPRLTS